MRRKAYWILENLFHDPEGYTCSRCRALSREAYAFCPNCGSRMTFVLDEEEEDFWDDMDFMEEMEDDP